MSLPALEWCLEAIAKPGHSLQTPAQSRVAPLVSASSRMIRTHYQRVSINCGLPCPSWAQQGCLGEVSDPSCTLCPPVSCEGRKWKCRSSFVLGLLSHLHFRKAESPRISQPHFQVLLTTLKLAVPALLPGWIGVGVTHCKKWAFLGPDLWKHRVKGGVWKAQWQPPFHLSQSCKSRPQYTLTQPCWQGK